MQPPSQTARLLLLRHAHSGWAKPGQRDFDRNLNERGGKEAAKIGAKAQKHGFSPTRITASPAVRCAETVTLFLQAFDRRPEVVFDHKLYNETEDYYLELANRVLPGETLMIVGHNPMIENVFQMLTENSSEAEDWLSSGYPTAGLSVFIRSPNDGWRFETALSP